MLIWQISMTLASDFCFFSGTLTMAQTDKYLGSSEKIKITVYLYTYKYIMQDKEV